MPIIKNVLLVISRVQFSSPRDNLCGKLFNFLNYCINRILLMLTTVIFEDN